MDAFPCSRSVRCAHRVSSKPHAGQWPAGVGSLIEIGRYFIEYSAGNMRVGACCSHPIFSLNGYPVLPSLSMIQRIAKSRIGVPGTVRRRFASAVLWNILASVVSRSMVLLAAIGCARFLGKTGFGQLGVVQSTANMVGAVATLGLGVRPCMPRPVVAVTAPEAACCGRRSAPTFV